MKRYIIYIEDCYHCPSFEAIDKITSYNYRCLINKECTSEANDFESNRIVKKELDKWFKKCPYYNIVSSNLNKKIQFKIENKN
jgi:hypothetical protein